MIRTVGSFVAAWIFVAAMNAPAAAAPLRWDFIGQVGSTTTYGGDISAFFPNGADAIFSVTIDPDLASPCYTGATTCFNYAGQPANAFTFTATIAGHEYFLPNREGGYANEFVYLDPGAGLIFDNSLGGRLGGDHVGLFGPRALDFGVRWAPGSLPSGGLPNVLPDSPVGGDFTLYLSSCRPGDPGCIARQASVSGTISGAHQIPEPTTAALVSLGALGLVAGQLVRRRRAATTR